MDKKLIKESLRINRKVLKWMGSGDTGISSKVIAGTIIGIKLNGSWSNYTPHDQCDFGRCYRLVNEHVPELKNYLPMLSKASSKWRIFINNWDTMERLYVSESPKLNDFMNKVNHE